MVSQNNWYVITGGPSSGKTTLLRVLEGLGHKVIHEAARSLIDEALAKGLTIDQLRANEKKFQIDVLRRKVQVEQEQDPTILTFFDRGMHDTLAYLRHYGWEINKLVQTAMQKASYRQVFLLDPLPAYENDYARTEDAAFSAKLTKLLDKAYLEYGMRPVRVPVLEPKDRADFVLHYVNQIAKVKR